VKRYLPATAAAVTAAAVAGVVGTNTRSTWYAALRKPPWQPPPWAFGPAWTTLYALIAVASARTLDRADPAGRTSFARALAVNLGLNTGWTWIFFTGKQPRAALAEIAVLEASTLDLVRRAGRVDRASAALLAPYAGWVAFATALNAEIARRNR
jgi:tryptophan-rich sensory protein